MKRTMIIYGLLCGLVIIVVNTLSMELGFGHVWLGYLVMLVAFSMIYVAQKQYRDDHLGGVISFKSALLLGGGISVVASIVYVLVWELYLWATDYAFMAEYTQTLIDNKRDSGTSAEAIAQLQSEMAQFRVQYMNPLYRLPITALEILPVGLLVSVISAALVRNHTTAH